MNKLIRIVAPLMLVATFTVACSSESDPSQTAAPIIKPPEPSADDICFPMYDFDSMTEDVAIYYNGEPKIMAPIKTVVPGGRQSYSVYFRYPMDRPSVQLAFQKNDNSKITNFNFKWRDDRTVVVIVDPTSTKVAPGQNSYILDANGAKTAGGRMLRKQATMTATVETPRQLWKVSLDGKQRERMTGFDQPFSFSFLNDNSTMLVTRPMEYCNCDAPTQNLYYTFDTKKKMRKSYPVALQRSYKGEGTFIADKLGFFFEKPAFEDVAYPKTDTATEIKVEGYVHGATFKKDNSKVLMIVGESAESNGKFQLVIHDLKSGKQETVEQEITANAPTSQVSDERIPVVFHQNGDNVYFEMQKPEGGQAHYQFNLESKQLGTMTAAVPGQPDVRNGVKESTDGVFRVYPTEEGLFKGTENVSKELNLYNGMWIKDTHMLAMSQIDAKADEKSASRAQLKLFNADSKTYETIATGLPDGTEVLGSSEDGKWIYVSTNGNLATK